MLKTRILYIEDDSGLASLTQRKLQRAGYHIDTAASGEDGLIKLRQHDYEIILVDLHLPTMDGLEFIKKVSEQADAPPLIIVSGTKDPTLAVEAMKLGVRDFLVKESNQAYLDSLSAVIERTMQQQHLLAAKNKAEQELHLLQTVVEQISDIVVIAETAASDPFDAKIVFANKALEKLNKNSIKQILGKPLSFLLKTETNPKVLRHIQQTLADGKSLRTELVNIDEDNHQQWLDLDISPILSQNNECTHFVAVIRDATLRKRLEESLLRRAEATLRSIGDAVITTDGNGFVDYLNPVAEQLTGWLSLEAYNLPLDKVFRVFDEQYRQPITNLVSACLNPQENNLASTIPEYCLLLNRSNQEYTLKIAVTPLGERLGVVVAFQDVTEERRFIRETTYNATHDALTGLVNRREFEYRLERVFEDMQREQTTHALCFMDLDQFKIVNDTCGHTAGDELLRQVSELLQSKIRKRDTLARLGGDEFALLMEYCPLEQAEKIANSLRIALKEFRFSWGNHSFGIGISIGLVPISITSGSNSGEIMKQADTACYVAKANGRNQVHIYQPQDAELAQRYGEIQWVGRIREAIKKDRFQLYAQPIIELNSDQSQSGPVHCYEILLQMRLEQDKLVGPSTFLPVAERYSLSPDVDRWVIAETFRQLAAHPQHLDRLSSCMINLSEQSIHSENFLSFVLQALETHSIPSGRICFEINETTAIANLSSASRFINELKTAGCLFALDNFGSGLSSFAYLKNLSVDFLKIDGVFVKDIGRDPIDSAMVTAINNIGHVMGKKTIAQHVETEMILHQVQQIGVDYAQGYFIGHPLLLSEYLSQNNTGKN